MVSLAALLYGRGMGRGQQNSSAVKTATPRASAPPKGLVKIGVRTEVEGFGPAHADVHLIPSAHRDFLRDAEVFGGFDKDGERYSYRVRLREDLEGKWEVEPSSEVFVNQLDAKAPENNSFDTEEFKTIARELDIYYEPAPPSFVDSGLEDWEREFVFAHSESTGDIDDADSEKLSKAAIEAVETVCQDKEAEFKDGLIHKLNLIAARKSAEGEKLEAEAKAKFTEVTNILAHANSIGSSK